MFVDILLQETLPKIFDEWVLYNKILKEDYMFHSEIFSKIQKIIESKFHEKSLGLLDIGCGDAFGIEKFLKSTNLQNYMGIDKSKTALSWAEKNLIKSNINFLLLNSDFPESIEKINGKFDIFLAGYSIHHQKTIEEKKDLLHKFINKLPEGGIFILFDIIKNNGETLKEYHERYINNCKKTWESISTSEHDQIANHIKKNDFPQTLDEWKEIFTSSGELKQISIDTQNPYYVLMSFQKTKSDKI